jgi:hypothetical protein
MVLASVRASEFGRFGFVRAFLGFAIGVATLFPITYSPLPLFLPSFPPTWAAHICRAVRQGVYISTDRPQRDEWAEYVPHPVPPNLVPSSIYGPVGDGRTLMRGGWDSPRDPGVL